MSRIIRLAAAALAIALTATIIAIVADDGGPAAPQQRTVRYAVTLDSRAPVVTGTVRGVTAQARPARYRLNIAPNTVVALDPRPGCHYVTWRATTTGRDAR
jgi:hypothetical protein